MNDEINNNSDILLYETEDGTIKIDVRLENESVWLSQAQMTTLFNTTKQNVSLHIKNVFEEGELDESSVVKKYLTTATDGKSYQTNFYSLDVIISVGYRVKSLRGTQFRKWATERIREYIVKGFTMNDEMLKNGGSRYNNYFEELLARIRDIRSSEKVFYSKVLDIFSTSIDYDPNNDICIDFFKVVQNKFHYASHGHTAAEVIHERVDAEKENMGLTSFKGKSITKHDTHIAKNYLTEDELDRLNRLVTIYLEFAELQALDKVPLTMNLHASKVDDILKMSGREILEHFGSVSHKEAIQKADDEYKKYKANLNQISRAEKDMLKSLEQKSKQIHSSKK